MTKALERLGRLERPSGMVDVVVDTDTYNEVDDQFALAYLLCSSDQLRLRGIYAAPFFNARSSSPADGMEKSYQEICRLLTVMGRDEIKPLVHRGSTQYLKDSQTPVVSQAALDLAKLAMQYSAQQPLYIIAIGAITNIASAIMLVPEICERITLVWLAGHAWDWPDQKEFNLFQDVCAARVIYDANVALVQLPCRGVVSALTISEPEMEHWLRGRNALCDDLIDAAILAGKARGKKTWTRIVWDVAAVAWLLNETMVRDRIVPTPMMEYDGHYAFRLDAPPMRLAYYVDRDAVVEDLFTKLAAYDK